MSKYIVPPIVHAALWLLAGLLMLAALTHIFYAGLAPSDSFLWWTALAALLGFGVLETVEYAHLRLSRGDRP